MRRRGSHRDFARDRLVLHQILRERDFPQRQHLADQRLDQTALDKAHRVDQFALVARIRMAWSSPVLIIASPPARAAQPPNRMRASASRPLSLRLSAAQTAGGKPFERGGGEHGAVLGDDIKQIAVNRLA